MGKNGGTRGGLGRFLIPKIGTVLNGGGSDWAAAGLFVDADDSGAR